MEKFRIQCKRWCDKNCTDIVDDIIASKSKLIVCNPNLKFKI